MKNPWLGSNYPFLLTCIANSAIFLRVEPSEPTRFHSIIYFLKRWTEQYPKHLIRLGVKLDQNDFSFTPFFLLNKLA